MNGILTSPSTGDTIGSWRDGGVSAVTDAVASAQRGLREVQALSRWERCDLLRVTSEKLHARRNDLVADLMVEHGKVRREAEAEADTAIHSLEMVAEYARRLDGSMPLMSDSSKRVLINRVPLGVVGVITPWNFPLMIPIEYLGPALVMGNSVVWKGAETTPRATAHIRAAFEEAGWPPGSLVVIEGGRETGAALVSRPELAAIGFTGSSSVGHGIAAHGGMRKLVLELGGNGPTVVFGDANMQQMARAVATAASLSSGQSCAATERVLVEASHYEEAVEAIVEEAKCRRVGSPDSDASFGPMHLQQTCETMRRHIEDACNRGARVVHGGSPLMDAPTNRYWPLTVLDRVSPDARVFREETFGPIIPITPFGSESELRDLIHGDRYGLNGAVFTSNLERAFRTAEALPCGTVVINDHSNVWEPHLPFGGYPGSGSGLGTVGGSHALEEFSAPRTLIINIQS